MLFLTIATSLPYEKNKNNIVLTDIDFPTVGHIWNSQERDRANISIILLSNGILHLEQYEKEVKENTRLMCVPHVSYYKLCYILYIKAIANIVHKKGPCYSLMHISLQDIYPLMLKK